MAGVISRAPLRLGKLIPQNTCLFLCDMQEKFRNNIQYFPQIVQVSARLLEAFKLLDLPVVATEQYPKGTLEDQAQAKLLGVTEKVFLSQQITKPTRQRNILDLFFTNNQEAISTYRVEKTIYSDHSLVTINTTYRKAKMEPVKTNLTDPTPFAKYKFFNDTIEWHQMPLGGI
ncbi:Isochorismatase domain-containing protein 2 [Chionoecetes opilio]|uniref:Isochorismatase domain-containing protein 2 n=1 Tax=Chionoecetes opilio TaxID=41210 RepID=A0A8J4YQN9_CHIOP|nr:Isochorismatase domain-containing protein 2 [Chionoecetes opilio]